MKEGEHVKLRRDLQPVRGRLEERDVILLRDPLALSSQVLAVSGGAVSVLQLMDGSRDIARVRLEAIHLADGAVAAGDDAQSLVEALDERYLLDNAQFRDACRQLLETWKAEDERPAAFAGSAYAADPSELARSIEDVLDHSPEITVEIPSGKLVAVVAPHIDLASGWAVYGAAYGLLGLSVPEPDRIMVLGTGHSLEGDILCPTTKSYVTPLGVASIDVEVAEEIRKACGSEGDDLPHKGEHSIEFQVVFLKHLFGDDLAPLVPVLCGDAGRHLEDTKRPSELPGVGGVIDMLGPSVADGSTLLVAGVDLSHVGPKFGDDKPSKDILDDAVAHETALIDALVKVDPVAFWAEARRVEDRYHVCGLSSLGILLELLPGSARGVLLCRDVMREPETSSSVGHAALAFFADIEDDR